MESPRGTTAPSRSVTHPPIHLTEGESVLIGGLELTIATIGTDESADEVRLEIRDTTGRCEPVEQDNGCVELVAH